MSNIHLAEEKAFQPYFDQPVYEQLNRPIREVDWSSDPMDILMAKQELERMELELELAVRH